MELTEDEKAFIVGLLKQLTISASAPESVKVVQLVQELLAKLNVK